MPTNQDGKEALLYRPFKNKIVDCYLCVHHCRINPGERGICKVRENREGVLYSLVYGKVISRCPDPIEKKPLFHFLPGTLSYSLATVGCNFRCDFCQNWEISQVTNKSGRKMSEHIVLPETIVREAIVYKCRSIAYTYTEPTIFFEYAYDTAKIAHESGLKNIFVTNGYQTPETADKMRGVIDAVNIDLKSFSEEFYHRFCGARLQPVLETIKNLYQSGIALEITTLVITGKNDSPEEFKKMADFLAEVSVDIPWHLSRFYPGYRLQDVPATSPETIYRAIEIGKKAGVRYLYAGNMPGNDYENSYCHHCQEVVVSRKGYTLGNINLKGEKCGHCGQELPFCLS